MNLADQVNLSFFLSINSSSSPIFLYLYFPSPYIFSRPSKEHNLLTKHPSPSLARFISAHYLYLPNTPTSHYHSHLMYLPSPVRRAGRCGASEDSYYPLLK
ncbi:hypothetical protein E2C01_052955 [Portunus trituberculatus]|uniref:Uncharacterized protein n=1 Tax=Portunus trituberculatus TaxID=210409 RepID=A0A5B7GJ26_PORTR|nr:hypothetical protein [Portunus trituberculatus]